jgi:hypothetical protein
MGSSTPHPTGSRTGDTERPTIALVDLFSPLISNFASRETEIAEFLTSFGLSREQAGEVIDTVGIKP